MKFKIKTLKQWLFMIKKKKNLFIFFSGYDRIIDASNKNKSNITTKESILGYPSTGWLDNWAYSSTDKKKASLYHQSFKVSHTIFVSYYYYEKIYTITTC